MSREVRRVPPDWQHPKRTELRLRLGRGMTYEEEYHPMHDESYTEAATRWLADLAAFEAKDSPDKARAMEEGIQFFWDWDGMPPDKAYYFPEWPPESRTHYQMYETTSEGTPISPVMAGPEELARWLADNKASAFGGMTATYEQWLKMIIGPGYSLGSMVMDANTGELISGVAAVSEAEK